jgi:hypothetical protein
LKRSRGCAAGPIARNENPEPRSARPTSIRCGAAQKGEIAWLLERMMAGCPEILRRESGHTFENGIRFSSVCERKNFLKILR